MGDDLVVSGGGRVTVATDELLTQAAGLVQLHHNLRAITRRVQAMTTRLSPEDLRRADAPVSALAAEQSTDTALVLLGLAEKQAWLTAVALHTAIQGYSRAELAVEEFAQQLGARLGYGVGFLSPLLLMMAAPTLGFGLGGLVVRGLVSGEGASSTFRDIGDWLLENNSVLTNPTTVALIRAAMGSTDDALGGLVRLPASVVTQLGDEGAGITGLGATAAVAVLLAHTAGMLQESGVVAHKTTTTRTGAPRSLAERVARLPSAGAAAGEQVRIERYRRPGRPDAFEVYIAGTVDFDPIAGDEPWDLTSNINGIAGLPAGSVEAVRAAMDDAGVTSETPLVLTGYSQGGLVASLVAASGDYTVQGVVTFGAPAGLVDIPPEVPVLTVRHTDDLVPALGGYDVGHHALVVERELFADRDVPMGIAVPAHQVAYYEETAALIDEAGSPQVRAALHNLDEFAAGAGEVESALYLARRIPVEVSARGR
jgi:hypothetical protein